MPSLGGYRKLEGNTEIIYIKKHEDQQLWCSLLENWFQFPIFLILTQVKETEKLCLNNEWQS